MGSRRGHGGSRELLLRHKSPISLKVSDKGFNLFFRGLESILCYCHYELSSRCIAQLQKLVSDVRVFESFGSSQLARSIAFSYYTLLATQRAGR